MPIYEYECSECGHRFEELAAAGTDRHKCPACGRESGARLWSVVSPPNRQHGGARTRDSEGRRGEREAARQDRLSETAKKRAAGEPPAPKAPKAPP